MDQQTNTDLDQADEEVLTSALSDEALEAAAGTQVLFRTRNSYSCCKGCD
jgi:hypothetical protein